MSKTLIGISAFGGLPFLEMTLRELQRTITANDVDLLVSVADPRDKEMPDFLLRRGIPCLFDNENRGFAANVNDWYDAAFVNGTYDHLICCGNDVIPMPGAVDAMIHAADTTEFQMICGSEFNAQFLVNQYPEAAQFFHGEDLVFTDFSARPWELHKDFRKGLEPHSRKDVRNLTLFTRASFEMAGYDDVNYWPNAYFADNSYCRRCDLLGVTAAGLAEGAFFHFTSRTIKQNATRDHHGYFSRNSGHYVHTWGGPVGGERYALPYDGRGMELAPGIFLKPELKIGDREQEDAIIKYWSTKS